MSEANVDIAVEAVTEAAQDALDDLGTELDDVGEAGSEASGGMDDASESMFELDGAALAAGGAVAGVGGAMQGAINSSQDWRESLGRTATSMGTSQDEAEDLAASISDATFPMDDAVETMGSLAQQGIDSEDAMADVAGAMDNVADATGDSAANIADSMGPALSAFGEDLEDAEDHMDTFTFVARNTTMDVGEFSGAVERLAPELQDMGMSLDDTAAVMAALEEEGITGRAAIREFRQATNDAEGDQGEFMDALGLTEDQLQDQSDALADAEGITEDHADAANESVTTMDRLGAAFDDVKLMAGGLLGPIDALAPVLMGLGGAAMTLSTINFSAVVPSLVAVSGALTPLLPIILPLVAAVGLLAAAWATDFMGIQETTQQVMDVVGERLSWAMEQFELFRERIMVALEPIMTVLREEFMETVEVWSSHIMTVLELLGQVWDEHFGWVMELVTFFAEYLELVIITVTDTILSIFAAFFALLRGDWEEALEIIWELIQRNFERITEFFGDWSDTFIDLVNDFADVFIDIWEGLKETVSELVQSLADTIMDIFRSVTSFVTSAWDLPEAVQNLFRDAANFALDVLGDMIGEATEALKEFATSLVPDWASEAVENFRDLFNDVIPSSLSIPSVTISNPLPGGSDWTVGGGSFDLPQLNTGGVVQDSGLAVVHEGEHIWNPARANTGNPDPPGGSGGGGSQQPRPIRVVLDVQGADGALKELIMEYADVRVETNAEDQERSIRRQNINTGGVS